MNTNAVNTNLNERTLELIKEYKKNKGSNNVELCNKTFETILEINRHLINYTINQVKWKSPITRNELELVSMEKLFEIVEVWKEKKGIKLTTYIVINVKYALINYIRDTQYTIKVPQWVQKTNAKIRTFEEKYNKTEMEYPTDEVLLANGFKKEEIEQYRNTTKINTQQCIENELMEPYTTDKYSFEEQGFEKL